VNALMHSKKSVSYAEIDAPQGHDSFLMGVPAYNRLFKTYMDQISIDHLTPAKTHHTQHNTDVANVQEPHCAP